MQLTSLTKQSVENLIYLLDDDKVLAAELIVNLNQAGYQVRIFTKLSDFESACEKKIPTAIIMDVSFLKGGNVDVLKVVGSKKKQEKSDPPLIIISEHENIDLHLLAVRAGAKRFLHKPLDIKNLIQTLDGLTSRLVTKPYRVLLIDDDEVSLQYNATMLSDAGMVVETLSNPLEGLKVLTKFMPDIVLIDIYMPECSGSELAQVIRHNNKWAFLPIVFLSTESDVERQLLALAQGGDDFLVKSMEAEHFVTAIIARARRARCTNRLHKGLEAALRENEFQLLTLNQHNSVSTTDINGKIISVNDYFCESCGYGREELLGQSHHMLNSSCHPNSFFEDIWNTITQGKVWHGSICNCKKSGEEFWVESTIVPFLDKQGKPYKYVTAGTDITALRQSEERFSLAVEGAGDGVWDWDMHSNMMQFSRHHIEMFGYAENELPHHLDSWLNRVHPDDIVLVKQNLQDLRETKKLKQSIELRLRCRNGGYKWVLCRGTVVNRDNEGKPIRMIGIQTDISKQKETEQALIKAREEAENSNRTKSQFLSSMSHELRTPMNAIMGFSQLLKMEIEHPLSETQDENIDQILKAGNHLLELINEVLDLSRVEAGRINLSIETVTLDKVIAESLHLITPLAQKRGIEIYMIQDGIAITLGQLSKFHLAVRADYTRLKQALLNLMSNAVKYNRENGKLIISCSHSENNKIRLSISDTGAGLTLEQQTQLFTPFDRLGADQTAIEGTGIGLMITKKIIELMGGNIGVDIQIGDSSTFWIELPNDTLPTNQKLATVTVEEKAREQTIITKLDCEQTVLYVEDNPSDLRLVSQLFGRQPNIHVWSAHEPKLGLELAQVHKPNLILLDINLPGMNGFEALK